MKRVVLTFGLLAGLVMSVMLVANIAFIDRIGFHRAEVIGYTTMVLAFLMVFFGIRSYRDNIYGGTITFGRAVGIGLLITLVASACYVVTWEVIYYWFAPDFVDRYGAYMLEQARNEGATEAELARRSADIARFREMFKNPLFNAAMSFIEVLPVGLVITILSAAILRRGGKTASGGGVMANAAR